MFTLYRKFRLQISVLSIWSLTIYVNATDEALSSNLINTQPVNDLSLGVTVPLRTSDFYNLDMLLRLHCTIVSMYDGKWNKESQDL